MNIRMFSAVAAFAAMLSGCASSPDSFEGAYQAHAAQYAQAMKAVVQAYQRGEVTQAEMQDRLSSEARELARSDAGTAKSEQSGLSSYSHPPQPRAEAPKSEPLPTSPAPTSDETSNGCLLIPCPEAPAQNAGQ